MKNFIYDVLKLIDQFGNSVQIQMNKKVKYTTSLGGIFTLTLFGIIIFFSVYFGVDMVFKKNPNLINYKSYVVDNETRVNNTNFFIAIQIIFPNKTILDSKNPYFRLDIISQSLNMIYANETKDEAVKLEVTKCNISHLDDFEATPKLKNYIKDTFTCIKLDNLLLNGSPFHSLSTNTLRLNLNFAYNRLIKEYGSELNLYLKGIFPLNFRMFYQSYSYDADNSVNPFKKQLAFAEARLVASSLTHIYGSFIRAKSVRDDGILLSSVNTTYLYGFNEFTLLALNNVFIPGLPFTELFKGFFYLDYYEENFIRSYSKIQDVGAQVAAMGKLFFFIMQFFIYFYSYNRINEQLAYRFYKFIPEKNIKPIYDYLKDDNKKEDLELNSHFEKNSSNSLRLNQTGNLYSNLTKREIDLNNKLIQSTTILPKIFQNSVFKGKERSSIEKDELNNERKSINAYKRKMAMKFNFFGNHLKRNNRATKTRQSILKDANILNNQLNNEDNEININLNAKEKVYGYSKNVQFKSVNNNPNTKVIESSLRVNNNNLDNIIGGRRNSFKINNDKTYIVEGEENENVKINTEKVIQNFTAQDMIKSEEKLGFIDKFKGNLCCKSKINPELKMKLEFYEKAGKRIQEKVDIYYILNMFEEFHKFKILFLNPYQSLALKYSKKPNIFNINFSNVVDYYERFCNTNDHSSNVKKVMEYFKDKIKSRSLDLMDEKLMELLDGDLKKAILMNV